MECDITWQASLGITFWNMVDLLAYATMGGLVNLFVWKALLDYLDLNKESISMRRMCFCGKCPACRRRR